MDATERQVINELFSKVRQAEAETGPRDQGAEELIREHVAKQPAAPYYMAQAIVIQEQALQAANARIQELEQEVESRPAGGGFLSSLFGGGSQQAPRRRGGGAAAAMDPRIAPYADPNHRPGGGGFLAGAMQTALGVAGGVLLGSMLASAFMPDPAAAAEEPPPEEDLGGDGGFGMGEEF